MKLLLIIAVALTPLFAKDSQPITQLNAAAAVLADVMAAPEKGIPQDLLDRAHCIVIVPDLKTKFGSGYLSCRSKVGPGWSAPAAVRIDGGSSGFQIGGSPTNLIMLAMNQRGADKLLEDKFTLDEEASVAAGPIGRTAAAQTEAHGHADILSWLRSQREFAGVAIEGATLRQDSDDNAIIYGTRSGTREIVSSRRRMPPAAAKFVGLLNRYSAREEKHESD
jgi:lipid-binding SYLF domain-containing protein